VGKSSNSPALFFLPRRGFKSLLSGMVQSS
jgi:hypothetical protein